MAYYYVKNSLGIRATGSTTKQTVAFGATGLEAADVYATVQLAITGGATSGDFILCSDAHSFAAGGAVITWSTAALTTSPVAKCVIMSVADANSDQYSAGAIEANSGSAGDWTISGNLTVIGVDITTGDRTGAGPCELAFYDMTLTLLTDQFSVSSDGSSASFYDCTLDFQSSLSHFVVGGGSYIRIVGGKIYSSIGAVSHAIYGTFNNGGGTFECIGVDLSAVDTYIAEGAGSSPSTDDGINVIISRCQLHADVVMFAETLSRNIHSALATNSAAASGADEYQYHYESLHGAVDDETGVDRDNSTAFPGGEKVSLKCVILSSTTKYDPFVFDMPARYAELSNTATDTVRIYLVSSVTLNTDDVWAELTYPDGTTKQTPNSVTTAPADWLLDSTTELDTNTESWTTAPATPHYYQIDLDTNPAPGPGADCVPIIRVYVATAATIYFCTSVDLV